MRFSFVNPWHLVALTALLIVGLSWAQRPPADPKDRPASPSPPRTAEQLPAFDKALRDLHDRVAPCTVNLFVEPKHDHMGSGVVIDARGLILTHAHHGQAPGTAFSAVFPDGKKVTAKLLGVHEPFDLSLVEITAEGGPWPAVALGDPATLKPGDMCVTLGYPKFHHKEGQPPLFRLGRMLGRHEHYLLTSCHINGGDSGGPLVDLEGKLLGNNNLVATERRGNGHTSVEYFRMVRPLLLAGRHVKHGDALLTGPFEDPVGLESVAVPTHKAVLTVLVEDRPTALGLVIDADGWAVTKASELPADKVVCKLADGRKFDATVKGRDRDHDLALLKLSAGGLPAAAWAEKPPHVGQVLAAVGTEPRPLSFGVTASEPRPIAGQQGVLGFEVAAAEDGQPGVRVKSVSLQKPRTNAVLRRGDVITHVEGEGVPDPEAFAKLVEKSLKGPGGRPGELLRLTLRKDGRSQTVAAPVENAYVTPLTSPVEAWSQRHDGFPSVFVYDGIVLASECGGPLVGADGKVTAVVIARLGTAGSSRTYAVPGPEVMKVVEKLRSKIDRGEKEDER